jgi:hypothetical protein
VCVCMCVCVCVRDQERAGPRSPDLSECGVWAMACAGADMAHSGACRAGPWRPMGMLMGALRGLLCEGGHVSESGRGRAPVLPDASPELGRWCAARARSRADWIFQASVSELPAQVAVRSRAAASSPALSADRPWKLGPRELAPSARGVQCVGV